MICPDVHIAHVHDKKLRVRALYAPRRSARGRGWSPEGYHSAWAKTVLFSLQSCSCTQDSTDTAKGATELDLRKYFCIAYNKLRSWSTGLRVAVRRLPKCSTLSDIEIVHGWFTERSDSIRASCCELQDKLATSFSAIDNWISHIIQRTWVRAITVDSQWVKLIYILYIIIVYIFLPIMTLPSLTKIVCITACAI